MQKDLAAALDDAEALILAVPHEAYLNLVPEDVVKWAGGPLAVIDCFGILSDDKIRRYFELGCEVKALGRGHIQRIKEQVRSRDPRLADWQAIADGRHPQNGCRGLGFLALCSRDSPRWLNLAPCFCARRQVPLGQVGDAPVSSR